MNAIQAGRDRCLRAKCRSAGFIKALPPLHSFQLYRDGVHRREINRTAVSLSSDGRDLYYRNRRSKEQTDLMTPSLENDLADVTLARA